MIIETRGKSLDVNRASLLKKTVFFYVRIYARFFFELYQNETVNLFDAKKLVSALVKSVSHVIGGCLLWKIEEKNCHAPQLGCQFQPSHLKAKQISRRYVDTALDR